MRLSTRLPRLTASIAAASLSVLLTLAACGNAGLDAAQIRSVGDTTTLLASSQSVEARAAAAAKPALPALFDDIERRTFNFFWETANPANGLVPDRWPGNPQLASIASVGFALTAYVDGVERGYITREQARDRVLSTVRFFANAPQGPAATGMAGHQGFFYHFLNMQTGERFDTHVELSTQDTSLLLAGMLFAQGYFDRADPAEAEIRSLVDFIYGRVDWQWAQPRKPLITMGWQPEGGFDNFIEYRGYDEAMITYVLALGSPTHPVEPAAWTAYTVTYSGSWGNFMGEEYLGGAPQFWHQYTQMWIDFRGIQDAYMRSRGLDYFENSRRATYAQRNYAVRNPMGWKGYNVNIWGLTASDGPGHMNVPDYSGQTSAFRDYYARGAGLVNGFDDGTLAPTAALASLPFAPELVIPATQALYASYGSYIYGRYGFLDAFNPSFTRSGVKLSNGQVVSGFGWVDTDYIGIDQGPIVGMIANYRSELVWKTLRGHPAVRLGLKRAGFSGGWLDAP